MRIGIVVLFILGLMHGIYADTAMYIRNSMTGTIFPVKNTSIILAYEILDFVVPNTEKNWKVRAEMHFLNPGEEVTLDCAFVTPFAAYHMGYDYDYYIDGKQNYPIREFTVEINGDAIKSKREIISYTRYSVTKQVFQKEASQQSPDAEHPLRLICYTFPVTFKKGMNKIVNEYYCDGNYTKREDYGIIPDFLQYIITSAKYWAKDTLEYLQVNIKSNNKISINLEGFDTQKADITINSGVKQIDINRYILRKDGLITLGYRNFKPINEFQIEGKVIDKPREMPGRHFLYDSNVKNKTFAMFNGSEKVKTELMFQVKTHNDLESVFEIAYDYLCDARRNMDEFLEILPSLSSTSLRILRNLPYAMRQYRFESQDLFEFYSQFDWYFPDEVNSGSFTLSEVDTKYYLEPILAAEKAKKNKE